jgi:hypothetical protein
MKNKNENFIKYKFIYINKMNNKIELKKKAIQLLSKSNCNLDNIITNIKILSNIEKKSKSDSIIFFGTLNLSKNESIEVAIKLSFERIENLKINEKINIDNSLEVETCIYKNIIQSLLYNKNTPNLTSYLGSYKCDELILNDSDSKILNNEINYLKSKNPKLNIDKKQLLILEKSGGLTLNDFLINNNTKESDILSIMIQIIYTLTIFEDKHLKHNDLHGGNIFIETLPDEISLFYANDVYGKANSYLKLKTKYIAKIYDFDSSSVYYNPSIPRNFSLDFVYCNFAGQCNGINPKFDLYTFLYVILLFSDGKNPLITSIVFKLLNKTFYDYIMKNNNHKFKQLLQTYTIPISKNLVDPSTALKILSELQFDTTYDDIVKFEIVNNVPIFYQYNTYYPSNYVKENNWNPFTDETHQLSFNFNDVYVLKISDKQLEDKFKFFYDTDINVSELSHNWYRELNIIKYSLFNEAYKLSKEFFRQHPYISKDNPDYSIDRYIISFFYLACPIWHKFPKNIQDIIVVQKNIKKEINNIWNVFQNELPINIPNI